MDSQSNRNRNLNVSLVSCTGSLNNRNPNHRPNDPVSNPLSLLLNKQVPPSCSRKPAFDSTRPLPPLNNFTELQNNVGWKRRDPSNLSPNTSIIKVMWLKQHTCRHVKIRMSSVIVDTKPSNTLLAEMRVGI
jgi:hypothetical protein